VIKNNIARNVYIVNFPGVGNGIMVMPVIKFLIKNNKYYNVFCTENGIIKNKELNKIAKVGERLFPVDPIWRRFNKSDWSDINSFLENNNIEDIYNFRNENLEEYEEFKLQYTKYSYNDLNFEKLKNRKSSIPIFYDIFSLFKEKGFYNSKDKCEWLSSFKKSAKRKFEIRIGFMVSASQMNKKLHYEKWVTLARLILNNNINFSVYIFSGITDEETNDAKRIVHLISNDRCKFVGKLNLVDTAKKIGDLDCFVSNDTGLIHMAGAIGIPTVGVYLSTEPKVWGVNSFVPHYSIKSDSVGKCEGWRLYAGTCNHFYDICSQARKQNITAKEIYKKIELATISPLSPSLVFHRLRHYLQRR
jgi:ADP-heptose:LPS heptosyltransferase